VTSGALLVTGTCSGAGKTTLVAGLCRWLADHGLSVAPFKAQNMSLNSFVTRAGDEIGRAQAMQAQAARVEPEAAMNPVLLKPGSDRHSQVVVLGRPLAEMEAEAYWGATSSLLDVVIAAYEDLRKRYDVVVCEGAGSPAEINLRARDIVNMGFARAVGIPSVVVGDIDRGGMFASFVGTLAVLGPEDQDHVRGFVVNRFRGERGLLEPGLEMLRALTGRPTVGVVPYVHGLGIDAEDRPDPAFYRETAPPLGRHVLRVGVVRLPRASNLTDLDPLVAEPGVVVRFVSWPEELDDADVVIVPGTRATVDDLCWLERRGIGGALVERAAAGRPILGICGGYQMLGRSVHDAVESGRGVVDGLGLLPVRTVFGQQKVLGRPRRTLPDGCTVEGYEIHHGVVEVEGGEHFFADEGSQAGAVAGTSWHGVFENDAFRRSWLGAMARRTGRQFVPAPDTSFAALRDGRLSALAELVGTHLDTKAVVGLIAGEDRPAPPRLSLSRTA